ncbi:hypothetical protein CY35_10G020600 [Sphagnum magellanicum]|nr:hypothetical protein CY35_10G020600 [Sphagnum magellanicum]KAH9549446.1 hypothetical protein CY35_10G020600 [Sphagnum magellanicum]
MAEEHLFKEEVQLDGARGVTIKLNHGGLLQWSGKRNGSLIVPGDLIGFKQQESSVNLYSFPRLSSSGNNKLRSRHRSSGANRARKDILIKFTNPASQKIFCDKIQQFLDISGRPKRLFVIVNPFGGDGIGKKVFARTVEPLLKAAGVTIVMQETQFQGHAKDLAKSFNLSEIDGIVCVSGDGVLVEVLNGLLDRGDSESAIKLPLGIIPAGTGNGMAKSVLDLSGEACDAATATFAIIRGHKQALDVAAVVQGQVTYHSILMLSWGFVADVDFESERYRWMGRFRLDIQTIIRVVNLRRYNGSFAYIPGAGMDGTRPWETDMRDTLLQGVETDSEQGLPKNGGSLGPPPPPKQAPAAASEWRAVDGAFLLIWLNNVPFAGEYVMPAPLAKFSDGCLDLVIMKECPRWDLFQLLLKIRSGRHIKSKYVEYLKVKAFQLTPAGRFASGTQGGYIDLDGEVLARGCGSFGDGSKDPMVYGPTIEVSVKRGLATIFRPP